MADRASSNHPRRSIPIFVPVAMTVRHAYGAAPLYVFAEQPQGGEYGPVVDVTPRRIEPGAWVIQWSDEGVTVEPATGEEIERWRG